MRIAPTINGERVEADVEPRRLLLDFLRDDLGLKGAKRSCEVQVCGTCTVLLDGAPVSACCMLAVEADGRELTTIEGFARTAEFAAFEDAFARHAAVQCGFCTGGILLTLKALRDAGETDLAHALDSNVCRCTGYRAILDAARELIA